MLVGVVGGDGLFDKDSRGNRLFFGGAATASDIGGESIN